MFELRLTFLTTSWVRGSQNGSLDVCHAREHGRRCHLCEDTGSPRRPWVLVPQSQPVASPCGSTRRSFPVALSPGLGPAVVGRRMLHSILLLIVVPLHRPHGAKNNDFLVKNDDAIAASQSSVFENNLVSHLLEKVIQYVFFLLKSKKKVDPNDSGGSGQTPQRGFV